jgi:hypothetical protein
LLKWAVPNVFFTALTLTEGVCKRWTRRVFFLVREFSEMRVCFVGRREERLHSGNVGWFVGDLDGGGSDG